MEILDLRLLRARQLEPLLAEETIAWRESLRWDYAPTAAMLLRYLEARTLTGYAVIENGRAIAYSFYIYENRKGLIGDAFISSPFRNEEMAVELLTHVVETLQAMPAIRRVEAQLIQLDSPGVRAFLSSQGFQIFDRKFLLLELPADLPEPGDSAQPAELRPWDGRWFSPAAELITRAYRAHVDSRISDQYLSTGGAARFLENIVHYPGCGNFYPEGSYLLFTSRYSSPQGLLLSSVVSEGVAHITQLCLAPELHGQGLGKYLLWKGLRRLQEKQFRSVTLTVTADNCPALRLYQHMGFSLLAVFPAFAWDAPVPLGQVTEKRVADRW